MLPQYYSHKNIFIIIINISDNYSFAQRSAHTSAIRYQIKKGTLTGALHFTKSGLFVSPARAVLAGARLSLAADSSLVLLGTARCASCVALPFVGLLVLGWHVTPRHPRSSLRSEPHFVRPARAVLAGRTQESCSAFAFHPQKPHPSFHSGPPYGRPVQAVLAGLTRRSPKLKRTPLRVSFLIWRRRRDSNPRYGSTVRLISSQVHSTTLPPLRGANSTSK